MTRVRSMNLICSSRNWSIIGGSFSISLAVLRMFSSSSGMRPAVASVRLKSSTVSCCKLGDALGVAGALLHQEGNLAGALLDLFGEAADLVAHAHDQFAQPLVLGGAHLDRFLQPADARQLAAHFADLAAQHFAVAHARTFQLALAGNTFFVGALHQTNQLGLGVLNRLFDLVEAGELRLRAGQPPLQLLNAARLFDNIAGLGFDALLEARNLGAVAPVLFIEPGHHLGELC